MDPGDVFQNQRTIVSSLTPNRMRLSHWRDKGELLDYSYSFAIFAYSNFALLNFAKTKKRRKKLEKSRRDGKDDIV